MKSLKLTGLTVIASLLLAACGGDDKSNAPMATDNSDNGKPSASAAVTESGTQAKKSAEKTVDSVRETAVDTGDVAEVAAVETEGATNQAMDMAKQKGQEYVDENKDEMMDMAKQKADEMVKEHAGDISEEDAVETGKDLLKDKGKG